MTDIAERIQGLLDARFASPVGSEGGRWIGVARNVLHDALLELAELRTAVRSERELRNRLAARGTELSHARAELSRHQAELRRMDRINKVHRDGTRERMRELERRELELDEVRGQMIVQARRLETLEARVDEVLELCAEAFRQEDIHLPPTGALTPEAIAPILLGDDQAAVSAWLDRVAAS